MKKIAIASLIALAATAASAMEMGVITTRDYSGANNAERSGYGLTLGEKFGKVGVTAGFERFTKGSNDQDRFSLVAGYDVATIGKVTVTPKVGVAYLDNQTSKDGWAKTAGVGASMPITKTVGLGVDWARQYNNKGLQQANGNAVTVGLTYKF